MANKITRDSVHAFIAGKPFKRENMDVNVHTNGNVYLRLWGNPIATKMNNGKLLFINTCGWFTNTTKERLNYLLYAVGSDLKIVQKKGVWYLNDKPWDGEFTQI